MALIPAPAVRVLEGIGDGAHFAWRVVREAVRPPYELGETGRQIFELGVRSVPLIALAGFAVGVVMSMHTRASLARFGAEALIPAGLAIALVRETGPLTAGLLLAGRVGAGIGAELGAMKVTEQIDALETLATDPVNYLVVPRFLAGLVMLPALTALADIVGMAGGYAVSVFILNANPHIYFRRSLDYLAFDDIYTGIVKAAVFGAIIAIVGCHKGFTTEGGAEGVGRATTQSVVLSSMLILTANYFITAFFF